MSEVSDADSLFPAPAEFIPAGVPEVVIEGPDDGLPERLDGGDGQEPWEDQPMPGIEGGDRGGDPPDTTDGPPVAAGDNEPNEPVMPADFGVERFREAVPGPEDRPHPSVLYSGTAELLDAHRDFADTREEDRPVVDLEREVPGGVETLVVAPESVIATFRHDNGARSYHQYYVDPEGVVRSDDRDIRILFSGLPRLGELSAEGEAEIIDDVVRAENENVALAHASGAGDRPVSTEELDQILNAGREAEPGVVSVSRLMGIFVNRTMGTGASEADSSLAAPVFAEKITRTLEAEGRQPDDPIVIPLEETRMVATPTGEEQERTDRVVVQMGLLSVEEGGEPDTPYVVIQLAEEMTRDEIAEADPALVRRHPDVQSATAYTTLHYVVDDGLFKCSRTGMLVETTEDPGETGRLLAPPPPRRTATADFLELDLLNKFFRKPRILPTKAEMP